MCCQFAMVIITMARFSLMFSFCTWHLKKSMDSVMYHTYVREVCSSSDLTECLFLLVRQLRNAEKWEKHFHSQNIKGKETYLTLAITTHEFISVHPSRPNSGRVLLILSVSKSIFLKAELESIVNTLQPTWRKSKMDLVLVTKKALLWLLTLHPFSSTS